MPETNIKAAIMLGVEPDRQNNVLRLRFCDPSNNVYALDLAEPMIGGLTAALVGQIGQLKQSGVGQPMTLTSGRPFQIGDGRIGLELTLDNALRLPVLFPKEAIPALRKTLDELERLSTKAPTPPRSN
jgi:hypothetical protein